MVPTSLFRTPPSSQPRHLDHLFCTTAIDRPVSHLTTLASTQTTPLLWVASDDKRRRIEQITPTRTYKPFTTTPIELVERILSYLSLEELLSLKRLDRGFNTLLSQPHLYSSINLAFSPAPHRRLIALLPSLLPGTSSLSLRSFSQPLLSGLLPHLTSRLQDLDLSFSAVRDEELVEMAEAGALVNVRQLKLKGVRGIRDGKWLATVLPRAEHVDLSWSGISTLPDGLPSDDEADTSLDSLLSSSPGSDDSGFFDTTFPPSSPSFPSLKTLSLSSCAFLTSTALAPFLSSLPPTLETLDLSHLSLTASPLHSISLHHTSSSSYNPDETSPNALHRVNLVGNDRLTLSGIQALAAGWSRRRREGGPTVEIVHNAVLESEDEDDVRRFVELVAGMAARIG